MQGNTLEVETLCSGHVSVRSQVPNKMVKKSETPTTSVVNNCLVVTTMIIINVCVLWERVGGTPHSHGHNESYRF